MNTGYEEYVWVIILRWRRKETSPKTEEPNAVSVTYNVVIIYYIENEHEELLLVLAIEVQKLIKLCNLKRWKLLPTLFKNKFRMTWELAMRLIHNIVQTLMQKPKTIMWMKWLKFKIIALDQVITTLSQLVRVSVLWIVGDNQVIDMETTYVTWTLLDT